MSVDGTWTMVMNTPMGEQTATLTLHTDGKVLTGMQTADAGSADIRDGVIDGDTLTWTSSITKPMALTLKFKATVAGDAMTGTMSVGFLGSFPFKATKG